MHKIPENNNRLSVAILFFTRTAGEEASVKRFISGTGRDNLNIAHHVIRHSHRLFRSLHVPVITITSKNQKGATFAERFISACEDVFELGYENVLTVGNDCLSLTRSLLDFSLRELQTGHDVLGPSTDGGAYLIGLNRHRFNKRKLLSLAWQTDGLFEQLFNCLEETASKPVVLLPVLSDVDQESDLRSIVHDLISRHIHPGLAHLLQTFLVTGHPVETDRNIQTLSFSERKSWSLRAPPIAA